MSFDARFEKIMQLSGTLPALKERFITLAAQDLKFTAKDTAHEVELTMDRLGLFAQTRDFLADRRPLGGPGSWVSLMLSYNGSAWLNTVIASCYLVGNRVLVKLSSKAAQLRGLLESVYRPIFGGDIVFYQGRGQTLMQESLANPEVSTVVVFGFDAHTLTYQEAFQRTGKKLVFEGPGVDPFIVFADADLDLALNDLMMAKFMYAGQTCTAPKRIFIEQSIYSEFLAKLVERVRRLRVGEPEDPGTDISPVASDLAVARLQESLEEAVLKGAKVLTGGRIVGNLVHPTVLREATDDMLGMREEVFGPVAFTSSFATAAEVLARARNHKYGLRAAVFGGEEARRVAQGLKGEDYCHPVPDYTFGKFGTVSLNEPRSESWRGALVVKPAGGYGYSGWIWETVDGRFRIKQGPKLISLETSIPDR
jgi:acyl-CoA reductase-like NAD-dependent aldehyde dehydrogenase